MTYESIVKLNNAAKDKIALLRNTYANEELTEDTFNIKMGFKFNIFLDKEHGFYIRELKYKKLKDYIIGYDIAKLCDWLVNYDGYLSNVSFLRDKLSYFKYVSLDYENSALLWHLIENVFVNSVKFKKLNDKEISKYFLAKYTYVCTIKSNIYIFRNSKDIYILCPYKIHLYTKPKLYNIKCRYFYCDNLDLNSISNLNNLFENNAYIEKVILKNMNLSNYCDINRLFNNCINLKCVELYNIPCDLCNSILFVDTYNLENIIISKCFVTNDSLIRGLTKNTVKISYIEDIENDI